MKIKRIFSFVAVLALILVLAVSMSSCDAGVDEESALYKNVQHMVDALIKNDKDSAREIVADVISDEMFDKAYPGLSEKLDGVLDYQLEILGWRSGSTDKTSYKNANLLLTTDKGDFLIFAEERADYEGLSVFQMQNYRITGTLASIKESNGWQIALLIVNILEIGFVIYAFVDCARSNIDKKPLLLIFIVLGRILFGIDFSSGASFSMKWFFGYTSYVKTTSAGGLLTLAVPVVAIVWFAVKKQLIEEKRQKDEAASETKIISSEDDSE